MVTVPVEGLAGLFRMVSGMEMSARLVLTVKRVVVAEAEEEVQAGVPVLTAPLFVLVCLAPVLASLTAVAAVAEVVQADVAVPVVVPAAQGVAHSAFSSMTLLR